MNRRRYAWVSAHLALIAGGTGCFPSLGPFGPCGSLAESPPASSEGPLIVSAEADSVQVGNVITLLAEQRMSLGQNYWPVWARWSSSDTSVATVESGYVDGKNAGLVRGKTAGRVTITASD